MIKMNLKRWFLLAFLVFGRSLGNKIIDSQKVDAKLEPLWRYRCEGTQNLMGCQRVDSVANSSSTHHTMEFLSLDSCRSVCGRWGSLWPRPTTAALSLQLVQIHPNMMRYDIQNVPAETRALLVEMTQVTSDNLMAECGGNVTETVDRHLLVYITVTSPDLRLDWDTQEQYRLDVHNRAANNVTVQIVAETIYGARHALETFTQLVSSTRSQYEHDNRCALYMVAGAKIKDKPVYKHRGLLLDTSRNFFPIKDIRRMIDGMAASKMNVFHWHITDSHSFPLMSPSVPHFTRYGAYSADEVYTVPVIKELIKYAQVRGVRVMMEIDAPAHAGNGWQWGKEYGLGDLAVCVNEQPWRNLCIQPPCGQLNPANPAVYSVLRDLYRDIAEMMPKPTLFHMGGDEIFFPCWNSNEEIVNYMKKNNIPITRDGFIELWAEFQRKALNIWDEEYKTSGGEDKPPVLLWSSDLTQIERIKKYLDKSRYIIEVWEPQLSNLLKDLLNAGYRAISVPKDVWYLDHGLWGSTSYSNWRKMYAHTLPEKSNMLGGEVAMWSEYIDSNSLDSRVWPRAAAVAERLWSDPTSPASEAESRLLRVRARLAARGLRPEVLSPGWCAQHEKKCI